MEYINNKEKLERFKKSKDFFAIIDFDRTLTTGASDASMGIIPQFLGGEYLEERTKIYEYYRPLELDYTISPEDKRKIMKEWATSSFKLLSKYLTSEEIIENSLKDANMYLRTGAKEFLQDMYEKNIPVVVMSAGVGNLIKRFLEKQKVLYDNIILISNFFEFKEDKAYIDVENIISTSNKDYSRIPKEIRDELDKKENILLCGDIIEDIRMIGDNKKDKTLTIGFLDDNINNNLKIYNEKFDIVLADEESFNTVRKLLSGQMAEC